MYAVYIKREMKRTNNYRGISIRYYIERVFSEVTKNKTKNMIKAKMSEKRGRIYNREVLFR